MATLFLHHSHTCSLLNKVSRRGGQSTGKAGRPIVFRDSKYTLRYIQLGPGLERGPALHRSMLFLYRWTMGHQVGIIDKSP